MDYPVYDISPQTVTNMAMLEEIRLLNEKVNRLVVCLESEQATNRLLSDAMDKLIKKVKKNGAKSPRNNKRQS